MASDDKSDDEDQVASRIAAAAERALREAEARRAATEAAALPVEIGGREGPEPTRFGDWEKAGVASDF